MNTIAKLLEIKKAPTPTEKLQLIEKYKSDEHLLELLKIAYDPMIITNIKSVNLDEYEPSGKFYQGLEEEFIGLVNYLSSTTRSKKSLKVVGEFFHKCSPFEAEVYAEILTKKLRIGVAAKSINKVVPGLINDFSVMKAYPIGGVKEEDIKFPAAVEEKLDGVRALFFLRGKKVSAFTARGQAIHPDKLINSFERLLNRAPYLDGKVFDGELLSKTRTKTTSIVNKMIKNGGRHEDSDDLEFHVFDLFSYEVFTGKEKGLNYLGRNVSLTSLFRSVRIPENIIQVESIVANNMKDVYEYFYSIKEKGGEGVILKNIAGHYETKKSKNWIKIKGEYSATLKVVGVILSDSEQFNGMVGKLVCEDKDGSFTIHVGSGLTEEQRKDFVVEDRIVGKLVEIKFNDVQIDDDGNPWLDFPVFVGVRFDKDEADDLSHIIEEIRSVK